MLHRFLHPLVALLFAIPVAAVAQPAHIQSLSHSGLLTWSSATNSGVDVVEMATDLQDQSWVPVFYDLATNGLRSRQLPSLPLVSNLFLRIGLRSSPPDPSLLLHLTFDNDFESGVMVDSSGRGNHALRYGRPCCPTNWPSPATGPDQTRAARFRSYFDGWGIYGRSGDYLGIPTTQDFQNLSNATISAWIWYFPAESGNYQDDQTSTILMTGHATKGIWSLGRSYGPNTSFMLNLTDNSSFRGALFPDNSVPSGDSGGWNHYLVTFDRGSVIAYFNGVRVASTQTGLNALSTSGSYIGIGCWTFNRTPWMDLDEDQHPNNAWINGMVDDIRIYNRTLDPQEITQVYHSFDKIPPTAPSNLEPRAASPRRVELRWTPSFDAFGVTAYRVWLDGSPVAEVPHPFAILDQLTPGASHRLAIQALDDAGHLSPLSPESIVQMPPEGSPIDLLLDDADPEPFVAFTPNWRLTNLVAGFVGSGYRHDNNRNKTPGEFATYRPSIPESGSYSVLVRYVHDRRYANNVPVDIVHAGITNRVFLDQTANGGTWVDLGAYPFNEGTNDFIQIGNLLTTRQVIADAVRWVK